MTQDAWLRATEPGMAVHGEGWRLLVDFCEPGIVRVRRFAGEGPPGSALIRYGFFRDDWPPVPSEVDEAKATAASELLNVRADPRSGRLTVQDASGVELLRELEPASGEAERTSRLRFHLPPGMAFFGLGDQTRERLEHRGTAGDLWGRNVQSYVPIPLVLTSHGFGILLNTTRRVRYDLGATSDAWFGFEADGGTVDYYVLYGPSLKEILARYTTLTGRPPLPPKWALGLWFICRTQADARELMDDCLAFRDRGIPCDAIGLEPGWMAKNYDFSVDKDWHPDRFPVPSYARTGRHNFFPAAIRMGFKPGLWLCNDYDLSFEEERRIEEAAAGDGADEGTFAEGHEEDEHLEGVRRMDALTQPDEPWFQHLKSFVDQGAHWFKQDGANQVLSHPDRLYGNGMHDDEMHNLTPLLYAKQMVLGFQEHTGRRAFGFTVSGWAGLQRYTATWTGDTGGEEGTLGACLNLSLSGHGMTTCDMEVTTREGIHFGFLLPWAQVNSWNYWRHPWYLGEELEAVFADYAALRYCLLPYLYAAAWEASQTGIPMLRAMPLEFPDDPECHGLLRQYMLGADLLVGAFTRRVYLPKGEWYDFWTEELHEGPGWVEPAIPENRGGPLFVRAGSVLSMSPVTDYVGQHPDDAYQIHAFAGAEGQGTIYEDDGLTFAHKEGQWRTTDLRLSADGATVRVEVAAATGTLPDAPEHRSLEFVLHGVGEPAEVTLNGWAVDDEAVEWDDETERLLIDAGERPAGEATQLVVTMREEG
ncbi:glycoside hydrolase family 31 protein [bacterium]|nr:glycoside hydrolase family 31 protein [bacterium]